MTDETPSFIVKQRGPSSARADFICLGKACQTKKGARMYELPVNATHCPMGHKRLQRIYTPPNISRGVAKRSDKFVEPVYTDLRQKKDEAKEQQRQTPMLAVPNDGNIASAVSRALGVNVGGSVGTPGKGHPGGVVPDLQGIRSAGGAGVKPSSVRRWNPSADDIAAARRAT